MCVHARAQNLSARLRSSLPLLRTDLRHWNQHKDLLYRQKYATYQLNNRTFSTQNTKISARSLAINMFLSTYCKKKKKKRERKKSHTINCYGKSGDSRTPGSRQGLYNVYAKLQLEKLQFLSLRAPGPHPYEKNCMFQTHTHNWLARNHL